MSRRAPSERRRLRDFSRREALSLAGLTAALGWYTWRAPALSRAMVESRAHSSASVQPFHLVAACLRVARDPEAALPTGDEAAEAARLLREALSLERTRNTWARRALATLDDDQVAAARAGTAGRQLPKSRAHRNLPTEMLQMEDLLARRFGSAPAEAPLEPDLSRWAGANPVEIQRGLLTLLEDGEPPLSEDQARAFLAALLSGLRAHELLPDTVDRLYPILGADVQRQALLLAQQPLNADEVLRHASQVLKLLEARAE